MKVIQRIVFLGLLCSTCTLSPERLSAQQSAVLWHNQPRSLHYKPEGEDFVLVNGKKRFNRALYGSNTAFRVETGDLPEFALYLPGMGGNLKFGIISGGRSKWLMDADNIEARYRPGTMLYTIKDALLGDGTLKLSVLAQADGEGLLIKASFDNTQKDTELVWAFGGATGKKFSRDGDIGADPESSFYLKPEYCKGNNFSITQNRFKLGFGAGRVLSEAERYEIQHNESKTKEQGQLQPQRQLAGIFPLGSMLQIANARMQESPLQLSGSKPTDEPLLFGRIRSSAVKEFYCLIQSPNEKPQQNYAALIAMWSRSELARQTLAGRIKVNTPDPYLNTLGAALAVAADGIWEDPTYLHGAVAWRMRLNAWRGAYTADPLGWHDRAKMHFSSYKNSQVIEPASGPVTPDTALHFARHQEKMGTAVFSSGYISRHPNNNKVPHHYDMNLVFFDQVLSHFNYTGDMDFAREMWPAIKRHLAWEKRNFDMDGDGLYDAYCAIWASDALQYSGGGVTHSSAYNYRANKLAAKLAKAFGEDASPYQQEADKILKAINANLWLQDRGWFAEYKDLLGLKLVHPYAGIWSLYHAIDSEVPDPFQAYQALRYIDTEIPRIPINASGLPANKYYTISTTNWQPYTWSLNNVAMAEVLHTALAYWQAGRHEDAFKLWESIIIESMYLSSSPGGFEQLSFYDAIRGELYRDFADPIGMASRSLVEGLFGINPNALDDTLTIKPGLPMNWDYGSLSVPDISFDFKRNGDSDSYFIKTSYPRNMNLKLVLKARRESVRSVTVNGTKVDWKNVSSAIQSPMLEITVAKAPKYNIVIEWDGDDLRLTPISRAVAGKALDLDLSPATVVELKDPQKVLGEGAIEASRIKATVSKSTGNKTLFAKVKQGDFSWWAALDMDVRGEAEIIAEQEQKGNELSVKIKANGLPLNGTLIVNEGKNAFKVPVSLSTDGTADIKLPSKALHTGTNKITFDTSTGSTEAMVVNWDVQNPGKLRKVDLSSAYNDVVTNIFKNKYLSPRPQSPTLQLPWQGIGNWCYPLTTADIDDAGLRKAAAENNEFKVFDGLSFSTPSDASKKNVVFTSQWDNYPDSVIIPLKGKSTHAYLLMAGSTNAMQTRIDNGEVLIYYTDGSFERLALKNPENWYPIEQDYFVNGYAFNTGFPKPYRVKLKTAEVTRSFKDYYTIKGFSNFGIDGGAATILDLPLNPDKALKSLKLKSLANDVVIGLMAVTLKE